MVEPLAGYGGLVSVGQQAFAGMGAYAMFGMVILAGWDPRPVDPDCRGCRADPCNPNCIFAFRLQGAYFASEMGHCRGQCD